MTRRDVLAGMGTLLGICLAVGGAAFIVSRVPSCSAPSSDPCIDEAAEVSRRLQLEWEEERDACTTDEERQARYAAWAKRRAATIRAIYDAHGRTPPPVR